LPWEAVKGFRVYEVSDHHTEFGFYALAFVMTMNKARYEALPADLKRVIDDNTGMKWALRAGRGFDRGDVAGLEATRGTGEFHEIAGSELAEWEAAAARTTEAYLKELDDQGLPGTETYGKVKAYVAECRAELNG
jgi:TRAP-type C4-dicarboxylate transport system substrate-binding protein